MKYLFLSLSLFLVLVVSAGPASAEFILMDYTGFAWETGGIPTSVAGDVLDLTAVALSYDPAFGVDPSSLDDIIGLVDDYPEHVVEFSTFSVNVGLLQRPTVIWEVRRY